MFILSTCVAIATLINYSSKKATIMKKNEEVLRPMFAHAYIIAKAKEEGKTYQEVYKDLFGSECNYDPSSLKF